MVTTYRIESEVVCANKDKKKVVKKELLRLKEIFYEDS